MHYFVLFLFSLSAFFTRPIQLHAQVNPSDSLAVLALYNATNGPYTRLDWDLNSPVSFWCGVILTDDGQYVEGIDLSNDHGYCINSISPDPEGYPLPRLKGVLPSELGNLVHLKSLDMRSNRMEGSIPESFSSLTELTHIDLSLNRLTGTIPDFWSPFTQLQYVNLQHNEFSGTIPLSLCYSNSLLDLNLSHNKLDGDLPLELIHLYPNAEIDLSYNMFSGCIPEIFQIFCNADLSLAQNRLLPNEGSNFCSNLPQIGAECFDYNIFSDADTINANCECRGVVNIDSIRRITAPTLINGGNGLYAYSFEIAGGDGNYIVNNGQAVGNIITTGFVACGSDMNVTIEDGQGILYEEIFNLPCEDVNCNYNLNYSYTANNPGSESLFSFSIGNAGLDELSITISNVTGEIYSGMVSPSELNSIPLETTGYLNVTLTNTDLQCAHSYFIPSVMAGNSNTTGVYSSNETIVVCGKFIDYLDIDQYFDIEYAYFYGIGEDQNGIQIYFFSTNGLALYPEEVVFDSNWGLVDYNRFYYLYIVMESSMMGGPWQSDTHIQPILFLPPAHFPCDDGIASNGDDVMDTECNCVPRSSLECPEMGAQVGDACEDGLICTTNTMILEDCTCGGGTLIDEDNNGLCDYDSLDDCGPYQVGSPCDDHNAGTINTVTQSDCSCEGGDILDEDNDGVADSDPTDNCWGLNTGSPCNDNHDYTASDVINENCECEGIIAPNYCIEISAYIGYSCDDGDPCTQAIAQPDCTCAGTIIDFDGDGICNYYDTCDNLSGQIGDSCNDGDACTINDMISPDCICIGMLQDSDNDGVCDASDDCPDLEGVTGDSCNDGDACTINDMISPDCICIGMLQDSDNDGVCDASDDCDVVTGLVGDYCDDNNPNTNWSVLDENCICTSSTSVESIIVDLIFYPNPADEWLWIGEANSYTMLYDVSGKEVMLLYMGINDITALKSGIYLLKWTSADRKIHRVEKLVVY